MRARLLLIVPLLAAAPASAEPIAGRASVIDGDTVEIAGTTIRLDGVDAPEHGQKCGGWRCGAAATDRLAEMIEGVELRCAPKELDRYGRTIATCRMGSVDLGAALVREGLAWAFVRYSDAYVAEEAEAKAARRGVWRHASQPPWEYRAEKWAAAREGPPGCPIKGNISESGERIYHPPWSPWYSRTRISKAKGERWFCDEAEALAAGWRAPRWR